MARRKKRLADYYPMSDRQWKIVDKKLYREFSGEIDEIVANLVEKLVEKHGVRKATNIKVKQYIYLTFDYLSDWHNKWPTTFTELAKAIGADYASYKQAMRNIYKLIAEEALKLRKKYSASQRAVVYEAMFRQAIKGDVRAQKEFLDRLEGPVKQQIEHSGEIKYKLSDDLLDEINGVVIECQAESQEKNK